MAFLTPALVTLRDEVDAMAPDRDKSADGWIGDPAHASRHSDHNPEADGSVDAIDITHDPAHGVDCNLLADQVKDDKRIKGGGYVIWNHRIWNPSVSNSWRPYTGSNPHDHHMHVSVADALQNDTSPWLREVDDVTPEDIRKIHKGTAMIVGAGVKRVIEQNQRQTANIREIVWNATGTSGEEVIEAIPSAEEIADEILADLDL